MKKLTCHCGAVEAEVNVPDKFEKVLRCNCSVCKRKGYVMSPIGENDMKITKGEDKLTLYQFYTNTAKHYFCSICGIFTHTRPRSNPKLHMINIACMRELILSNIMMFQLMMATIIRLTKNKIK